MYIINSNLKVSTPLLIEILETNSFSIKADESGVFIYDNIYKEQVYCPFEIAKTILTKTNSFVYKHYIKIITDNHKQLSSIINLTEFQINIIKNSIYSAEDLLDLLQYYTAIKYCTTKLSRVKRLVQEYTVQQIVENT